MKISNLYRLLLCTTISLLASEQQPWMNWAGNQKCCPQLNIAPSTLKDLQTSLHFAQQNKLQIRAVGKGYSRSDIATTNDCMISIQNLNKIIEIDSINKRVKVESGIELKELSEKLAEQGLSLSNLPATSVTLGGAVSTAVHGTGKTGSLSSFITEIEMLTADGSVKKLSKEQNPELFAAARVSMGALGIIYSLTLQCESLFDIQPQEVTYSFEEVIKNYKKLYENNDYFQFIWHIDNNMAITHLWNKIDHSLSKDLATTRPSHETLLWFSEVGVEKDLASEYAIPFENLEKALQKVKVIYEQYKDKGFKTAPVVVRFAQGDKDILMSPCGDRKVAYVNIWSPVDDSYLPLLRTMDEALCELGGRPHWGKINFLDYEKASQMYGSKLTKFIAAKKKLDPDNLFSNDFVNRLYNLK
ncbi:MAG: D-arabinono-1,4-lactone oxidase [Candidatus Dependentiae bacterium]